VLTTSRNSARQTGGLSGVQGLRPGVAEKATGVHPFVRNNESETIINDTHGSCLFELTELVVDNIVNGSQRIGDVSPVTRSYENFSVSTHKSVIKLTVLRGNSSLTRHAGMLASNTLGATRGNTGRAGGRRRRKTRVRLLLLG
jgi:hypothetical protein